MEVKLNTEVGAADLAHFDSVVVATGVTPRKVKLPMHRLLLSVSFFVAPCNNIAVLNNDPSNKIEHRSHGSFHTSGAHSYQGGDHESQCRQLH